MFKKFKLSVTIKGVTIMREHSNFKPFYRLLKLCLLITILEKSILKTLQKIISTKNFTRLRHFARDIQVWSHKENKEGAL